MGRQQFFFPFVIAGRVPSNDDYIGGLRGLHQVVGGAVKSDDFPSGGAKGGGAMPTEFAIGT